MPIDKHWFPEGSDGYNLVKAIEENSQLTMEESRYGAVYAGTLNPDTGQITGTPNPILKKYEFLSFRFEIAQGDVRDWTVTIVNPHLEEWVSNGDTGTKTLVPVHAEAHGHGSGNADLFIGKYFDDRYSTNNYTYDITWTKNNGKKYSTGGSINLVLDPNPRYQVGAFIIPVMPVAIVYAPPVDASKSNFVSYTQSSTVGTTYRTTYTTEHSVSTPSEAPDAGDYTTLDVMRTVSKAGKAFPIVKAFSDFLDGLPKESYSINNGKIQTQEGGLSFEGTIKETHMTEPGLGPGMGDIFYYLLNAEIAWIYDPTAGPHDTWQRTGGPATFRYVVLNADKGYKTQIARDLLADYKELTGTEYQGNPTMNLCYVPRYGYIGTPDDVQNRPTSMMNLGQAALERFKKLDQVGRSLLPGSKKPAGHKPNFNGSLTQLTASSIASLLDLDGFATLVSKGYPLSNPTPPAKSVETFDMAWALDTSDVMGGKHPRYVKCKQISVQPAGCEAEATFSKLSWDGMTDTEMHGTVLQYSKGWFSNLLGGGGQDQTVVTNSVLSNFNQSTASETISTLVHFNAGVNESYCIDPYYDTAFGTFAFVRGVSEKEFLGGA